MHPDRNQMAVARAAKLIWEARCGRTLDELMADYGEATFAQAGQMTIDAIGYDEIMRHAEAAGWVERVRVEQSQSAAAKKFIGDVPPSTGAIVEEAFRLVMTKTAPVAITVSQLDSPAPGPADLVAVGIFAVSLVAVGGISIYIYVTHEDSPVPTPQPQPAPPPAPPPPPPRETCEANSELKKYIRCDDPGISHYDDRNEDKAYDSIKVKGKRKEESKTKATGGPCKNRGGFHTKVKSGKDYIASIVGCFCCNDASGKAVKSERTEIQFKP